MRTIWVSTAYGYNGDLMYFGEIFRQLSYLFPKLSILVGRNFDVKRYPDLPLEPSLRFVGFSLTRTVNGVPYEASLSLPTLRSIMSFFLAESGSCRHNRVHADSSDSIPLFSSFASKATFASD